MKATLVCAALLSYAAVETCYQHKDEIGEEGGICHCRQRVRTSCYRGRDGMGGRANSSQTLQRCGREREEDIRERKTSPPSNQTYYSEGGNEG